MNIFVFCVKNHLLCGRISAFSLKIEKKKYLCSPLLLIIEGV